MTITIPRRGRAVLLAWAFFPGAVIAPFFFWQGIGAGVVFCAAWALLLFCLWMRAASMAAALEASGRLTIYAGVVFPTVRTLAPCGIVGTLRLVTPLLRCAGCCLLILRTTGGPFLLPAIPAADAETLCTRQPVPAPAAGKNGPTAGSRR